MREFSIEGFNELKEHELFIVELSSGQKKYAVKEGDKIFSNTLYAEYTGLKTDKPKSFEIPVKSIKYFSTEL